MISKETKPEDISERDLQEIVAAYPFVVLVGQDLDFVGFVLHLIRKYRPEIPVVFNNTGVEHRETYDYRTRLNELWNLNLIETKPEKGFWDCVEEYGLPRQRHGNGSPRCCYHLKELPMRRTIEENGFDVYFTGLTADESMNRRLLFLQYGASYCTDKHLPWRMRKVHPIMIWTADDVWKYIRRRRIPYNPIYDNPEVGRVGCSPCTGYRNWKSVLRATNPKMYDFLMTKETAAKSRT